MPRLIDLSWIVGFKRRGINLDLKLDEAFGDIFVARVQEVRDHGAGANSTWPPDD